PPTKWTISSTSPSASLASANAERGAIVPLCSTATFSGLRPSSATSSAIVAAAERRDSPLTARLSWAVMAAARSRRARLPQAEEVPGGHQRYADHGQRSLRHAVRESESAAHEGKTRHGHNEGEGAPMPNRADTDSDGGDDSGEHQPDAVNSGIEENSPTQSQACNDDDTQDAMQRAKARQEQSGPIQPTTNQRRGGSHARHLCNYIT